MKRPAFLIYDILKQSWRGGEQTPAAVGKTENIQVQIDQQFGSEAIYQIGLDKGVRLIGTHDDAPGIFRVFLIDYHHDLYPDEKRTKHGSKELKFCPMKSD